MPRRILGVPLAVAVAAMCLTTAPAAAVGDWECGVILPAADRLEPWLDAVSPTGTPSYVAGQIRNAVAPLHGVSVPAAIDLRIRSGMLASQIDASDPYRPASPEQLADDLAQAKQLLAAARDFCAP
ncbi:hypothetical protein A5660_03520 [Mycobacterium alsense]|uniref:hypothetical protein n=1 Tax=Mycobacterium alsense TaxID=324058 RepID=UPI00080111E0|nr:hypothetical protein [Mycobacterium alsense]OBI99470.1 hypothetical protein A5660_03520 [Mycobacterium alsense]